MTEVERGSRCLAKPLTPFSACYGRNFAPGIVPPKISPFSVTVARGETEALI